MNKQERIAQVDADIAAYREMVERTAADLARHRATAQRTGERALVIGTKKLLKRNREILDSLLDQKARMESE